jgi:UDP-N-acetylglucosamine 4,6-dehydratase
VIAPDSEIKVIGIRPGEKLYETLISENEAPNTYEFKDMYVIRPVNLFREPRNSLWSKGKKMKDEKYDSNINKVWLTAKQLKAMIE